MTMPLTPPDRLSINVAVEDDRTVSKFVVRERGTVTFYNKGAHDLTLRFEDATGGKATPFCKGKKPDDNPVVIPRNGERTFTVCEGNAGRWFKYSARIGKAAEEDPIIFVE